MRVKSIPTGALLVLSALSLMSCQFFKSKPVEPTFQNQETKRKRAVKGIGDVVSLNTEAGFVLIDVTKPVLASKANFFYIEKGSRKAVLNPTGEKIGSYLAADILSGEVKLGDGVLVKLPKPPSPPEPVKSKVENKVQVPLAPPTLNAQITPLPSPLLEVANEVPSVTPAVDPVKVSPPEVKSHAPPAAVDVQPAIEKITKPTE